MWRRDWKGAFTSPYGRFTGQLLGGLGWAAGAGLSRAAYNGFRSWYGTGKPAFARRATPVSRASRPSTGRSGGRMRRRAKPRYQSRRKFVRRARKGGKSFARRVQAVVNSDIPWAVYDQTKSFKLQLSTFVDSVAYADVTIVPYSGADIASSAGGTYNTCDVQTILGANMLNIANAQTSGIQPVEMDYAKAEITLVNCGQQAVFLDFYYCTPRIDNAQSNVFSPANAIANGIGATYLNTAFSNATSPYHIPNLTTNWRIGVKGKRVIQPGMFTILKLGSPIRGTHSTDVLSANRYMRRFTRSLLLIVRPLPAHDSTTSGQVNYGPLAIDAMIRSSMKGRVLRTAGNKVFYNPGGQTVTVARGVIDESGTIANLAIN